MEYRRLHPRAQRRRISSCGSALRTGCCLALVGLAGLVAVVREEGSEGVASAVAFAGKVLPPLQIRGVQNSHTKTKLVGHPRRIGLPCCASGVDQSQVRISEDVSQASRPNKIFSSKLDWLAHYTDIIPDAYTIEGIDYQPRSATVSGGLILRLLEQQGQKFIDEEVSCALCASVPGGASMTVSIQPKERLAAERRNVYATVAAKLARTASGRVSVEVDPRLFDDANKIVQEVRELAKVLNGYGTDVKDKILFKIPGTWEGILAAKMITLQEEFSCQVTHVYSMAQATTAAEAGVAVIQPYVGRINEWYKKNPDKIPRELGTENHGVRLVQKIHNYLRKYELPTKLMAASIRTVEDAIRISGIDYMVLSPQLIKKLASLPGNFEAPALSIESARNANFTPQELRGHILGECAEELLQESIKSASDTIENVEDFLSNTAIGNM